MIESAKSALLSYQQAMKSGDLDGLSGMFSDFSLLEHPFIKPGRLVGDVEILAAHRETFTSLEFIEIDFDDIAESGEVAIAEGELCYRWKEGEQYRYKLGAVAEMKGNELRRLSLYCDARNARLWSDKTIL